MYIRFWNIRDTQKRSVSLLLFFISSFLNEKSQYQEKTTFLRYESCPFKKHFLFWNSFTLTEQWQSYFREFSDALHPVSIINILN